MSVKNGVGRTDTLIQFPFLEMVRRTGLDNHPPLYFVLLKIWASVFGYSTFALRALSALCGIAACFGTYLMVRSASPLCKDGCGRIPALIAAAMIALSAFQIRWSWDVRMYSLGLVFAVYSSAAMFRALAKGRFRDWLLYAALALAFAYTHYYAFFSVFAQFAFVVAYLFLRSSAHLRTANRGRQFRSFAICAVLMAIGYLPWLPTFERQRAQVQKDYWTKDVRLRHVTAATYGMLVMPENDTGSPPERYGSAVVAGAILLALCWKPSPLQAYLLLGAALPLLGSILVSMFDTKVFHLRYFLFAHAFLFAGLGVVLGGIADPVSRWTALSLVIGWLLFSHLRFLDELDMAHRPGGKEAIRFLVRSRKANERVIVSSPLLYFSALHYAGNHKGWYVFSEGPSVPHYEGSAALIDGEIVTPPDVAAIKEPSVWVIDMTGWGGHEVSVPSHWSLQSQQAFKEVLAIQGETIVRHYRTHVFESPR